MKVHALLLIVPLFLSSCASILNSKMKRVTIATSRPVQMVINNDTLKDGSSQVVSVERSKKPLEITLLDDSLKRTLQVKARLSLAYHLNFYPYFFLGFLIDGTNSKRYTYPRNIYISLDGADAHYSTLIPLDSSRSGLINIIKVTPLKIAGFSNASMEVAFERKMTERLATQFTAGYLLPYHIAATQGEIYPNYRGLQVSVEGKFYHRKSAPQGPYLGIELALLRTIYNAEATFLSAEPTFPGNEFYRESFRVSKKTYTTNFKIGYQRFLGKIAIDSYMGLGLRYKEVSHQNRAHPQDSMYSRHPTFHLVTNRSGRSFGLSIPLNFRVGYLF